MTTFSIKTSISKSLKRAKMSGQHHVNDTDHHGPLYLQNLGAPFRVYMVCCTEAIVDDFPGEYVQAADVLIIWIGTEETSATDQVRPDPL